MTLHPEILSKDGQPQFAVLPYEEFIQIREALEEKDHQLRVARARLIESQMADPKFGSPRENLSAQEIARRQGVGPITNFEELRWPWGPEDWEGFEEAVVEWRKSETT